MPPENSLFGQEFPCSAKQNSLFRFTREMTCKVLELQQKRASGIPKRVEISRNSLIFSLFSGKSVSHRRVHSAYMRPSVSRAREGAGAQRGLSQGDHAGPANRSGDAGAR